MTDIVKISDAGHVSTIALNRPEKKNALSDALAWGVIAAVEDAARTDDLWLSPYSDASVCSGWICPAANARRRSRGSLLSLMTSPGSEIFSWRSENGRQPAAKYQIGGRRCGPWSRHGDRRAPDQPQRKAHGWLYENRRFTRRGLTITLPQAMGYEQAMRFMMENRTCWREAVALAWPPQSRRLTIAGRLVGIRGTLHCSP